MEFINTNITCFVSGLIGSGIIYGTFKTKLQALQKDIDELNNHKERLTAIETKLDFLITQYKKQ